MITMFAILTFSKNLFLIIEFQYSFKNDLIYWMVALFIFAFMTNINKVKITGWKEKREETEKKTLKI